MGLKIRSVAGKASSLTLYYPSGPNRSLVSRAMLGVTLLMIIDRNELPFGTHTVRKPLSSISYVLGPIL